MADINTAPKFRMLLTIGIVSVCLLVAVKFGLESYYLDVTENFEHDLLPKTEQLDGIRKAEHEHVDNGAIPVSVAMQTLAQKGRDNASPLITPQPSDDLDPLRGWNKTKREVQVPAAPVQTFAPVNPGGGPVMMDGGAPLATDAGVLAVKDGGAAPHAATDGGHR